MKETVGAVIKAARTEGMELTRAAFAARVAVTDQTVYYWEVSRRHPRYDCFVRLLAVVPPRFALRLLVAAGMADNAERWAIRLVDEIELEAVDPADVFGDENNENN